MVLEYNLLCDILVLTLFHDVNDRSTTGQRPSYDGVVLITGKTLESQPVWSGNVRTLADSWQATQ